MKLKALKNKSKYKSTSAWLDAVYRNNRDFIDSRIQTPSTMRRKISKRAVFKQLAQEYMDEGLSPIKALDTLSKSTIFTSEAERIRSNAFRGIKGDKEAFREFRRLAGWNKKIDESKMKWDKEQHMYIYDNRVTIQFDNSPYQVIVGLL